MRPKPTNIVDSRAIVFECKLYGKWKKIGYILSDILDEVYTAISANLIMSVKFKCIKYVTHWTQSILSSNQHNNKKGTVGLTSEVFNMFQSAELSLRRLKSKSITCSSFRGDPLDLFSPPTLQLPHQPQLQCHV